jgi:hypothetical protein
MSLHINLKELEMAAPGQRIEQVIGKACINLYKLIDSAIIHCIQFIK